MKKIFKSIGILVTIFIFISSFTKPLLIKEKAKEFTKARYFVDTSRWMVRQFTTRETVVTYHDSTLSFGINMPVTSAVKTSIYSPGSIVTEYYAKIPDNVGSFYFDSVKVKELIETGMTRIDILNYYQLAGIYKENPAKYILLNPFYGFQEFKTQTFTLQHGKVYALDSFVWVKNDSAQVGLVQVVNIVIGLFLMIGTFKRVGKVQRLNLRWDRVVYFALLPQIAVLSIAAIVAVLAALSPEYGLMSMFGYVLKSMYPLSWLSSVYFLIFYGIRRGYDSMATYFRGLPTW